MAAPAPSVARAVSLDVSVRCHARRAITTKELAGAGLPASTGRGCGACTDIFLAAALGLTERARVMLLAAGATLDPEMADWGGSDAFQAVIDEAARGTKS